jgi:hypothetical protein
MTPNNQQHHTNGRAEARQALAESRESSQSADRLILETQAALAKVRASREQNHFTDKFRAVIRGSHG